MRSGKVKLSNQEIRELQVLQEHPGWSVFLKHINGLIEESNRLSQIPNAVGTPDTEVLFAVRVAQARVSVYNGLIGFMNEVKIKAKNTQEENDG